jgi:2-keto-4-pentenoate hydratase/2-oxohepta-3-ene-1,7-dioic acid hydratase in catechol pathway
VSGGAAWRIGLLGIAKMGSLELPFTLAGGDVVAIAIDGIGALVNPVIRGRPSR